eukprot:NODE_2714_length_876_cov_72.585248_g2239_i0.p2 GENE.NODE_2714_length_876_cov_72.585248_g2239_i0~~NODE_2714_length_876_cov_72.585248_g2239_i0.p2  ORF type:complete len:83 (+),score=12.39 NODE_2714_length_876_cov_72.585248_g2239_i0:348-596(+)
MYTLQAMLSSQFYCEGSGCPTFETVNVQTAQRVRVSVWKATENNFGLVYKDRWYYILILFCLLVAIRFGTFLGLRYVNHAVR